MAKYSSPFLIFLTHHVHERVAVVGQDVVLDGLHDAQALSASVDDFFWGVNLQKARLPVKGSLKQQLIGFMDQPLYIII